MSAPVRIAVVTCLRDEGPFVVDWVAHLRALGVGRVLAFTNDCRDGTEAVLDALVPAGVVHVPQGAILGDGGAAPQWRAMAAAWVHEICAGADWLAHLDVDEFVALDGVATLPELIAEAGEAEALALPWRLFGSDGRIGPGSGPVPEPVPARFGCAAPPGAAFPAQASFFKTLFRRDGPFEGFGIHRPRQVATPVLLDDTLVRDEAVAGDASRILLWRGGREVPGRRVQLNHYSVRSVHEFLVKAGRGLPNRTGKAVGLDYWVERNFADVACAMIAPQMAAMRAEAARLRGLGGVAEAESVARAWHAAELARVLATADGAQLYGRLVLAGPSRAPGAEVGRALLAAYARTQEAAG